MSYSEWRNTNGFLHKEWIEIGFFHRNPGPAIINHFPDGSIRREEFWIYGNPHRESGPAKTLYFPDGSIEQEEFWIWGNLIGRDNKGFWALWKRLNEEQRQSPEILKCLARYS